MIVELSTQSVKALRHSMGDRLFIRSLYMVSTINPWGGEVGSANDEQL